MAPYFESGDPSLIKQAKERYRRMYKAMWRKTSRRETKAVTVQWSKEEYRMLKHEAERHNRSITRFVKEATIGYINNRYVPLHRDEIQRLLQLIGMTYNRIEEVAEDRGIAIVPERELKEVFSQLEQSIRIVIYSPKTVWQILDKVLSDTPEVAGELLSYIKIRSP